MAASTKPGIPLGEDELLAAVVGDVITTLKTSSNIADAIQTLEWMKARLEQGFDKETGARRA